MALFNMHEAKSGLSQLVARAEAGEEIVIARHNIPVAKIVPLAATGEGRNSERRDGFGEEAQVQLTGTEKFSGLTPGVAARKPREPGALKGMFTLPDSFFDPLPEDELAAWEGKYSFDPDK